MKTVIIDNASHMEGSDKWSASRVSQFLTYYVIDMLEGLISYMNLFLDKAKILKQTVSNYCCWEL